MSKYINPYNFIPLQKEAPQASQGEGRLCGVIEYTVMTRSPLFIPNTSNDHALKPEEYCENEAYHKSYEFFAYEDLSGMAKVKKKTELLPPVIPASEIRGMLRSQYEIITNSCLSILEDELTAKRTSEVFKAGLIKRVNEKTYELYEADDVLLRTNGENNLVIDPYWDPKDTETRKLNKYSRKCYVQKELREGQKVKVSLDKRNNAKWLVTSINGNTDRQEGYVIKGEDGPDMSKNGITPKNQKHCAHVFLLKMNAEKKNRIAANGKQPVRVGTVNCKVLEISLECYKKDKTLYKEYGEEWKKFKEGSGETYFPVYYSKVKNNYIMLSPASITREIYENKITQMVMQHQPCVDKAKLCPACSLFGTLTNKFSSSSRIRFTDLTSEKYAYEDPIMLKELASPKIGNVEFYLQRPKEAVFWTYDYYIDAAGNVKSNVPTINGRKIYWHIPNMRLQDAKADEKTERNITVRPVASNSFFSGKLYFDNITEDELETLIFMLEAGDFDSVEKKKHGYKLGNAKPLGFGSVSIGIDNIAVRKVVFDDMNKSVSIKKEPYQVKNSFEIADDLHKVFSKVTNFEAVSDLVNNGFKVEYPHARKGTEDTIFNWFVQNHKGYKYKSRENTVAENGMPNERKQMYFNEYMIAGTPELKDTDAFNAVVKARKAKKEVKGNSSFNNAGQNQGRDQNRNWNKNQNRGQNNKFKK